MNNGLILHSNNGIEFYLTEQYGENELEKAQQKSLDMLKKITLLFDNSGIDYVLTHGALLGLMRHNGFIPWDDDCDLYVLDYCYDRALEVLEKELSDDIIIHNEKTDPIYWCPWTKLRDRYSRTVEAMWPEDRKLKYHGICIDLLKATVVNKEYYLKMKKADKKKRRIHKLYTAAEIFSEKGLKFIFAPVKSITEKAENKYTEKYEFLLNRALNTDSEHRLCIGSMGTILEAVFDYEDIFPTQRADFEGVSVNVPAKPDKVLSSLYGNWRELPPLEKRLPHFSSAEFFEAD